MFNVPFKNPLEAETVSQRRERKARESEGSVRSSTSSSRARLGGERGSLTKKIPIFGFAKAAITRPAAPAAPDGPDKAAAKQDVDVHVDTDADVDAGPSELAGSPVLVTSPSYSPVSPAYLRPLSGFSISPSVYPQEAVDPASGGAAEEPQPAMDVSVESFQQWGRRRSQVHADNSRRASYASPVESTRLASPVQMERNSAGQAAQQRPERYPVVRYASTSSTCTTGAARSDTICTPNSTPETVHSREGQRFPFPVQSQRRGHTQAVATSASSEQKRNNLDANAPPVSSPVPVVASKPEHVQAPDWKSPARIRQMVESLPLLLLIIQSAPIKVLWQRLYEDWAGASSEVTNVVTFQKKLWALVGLRRLNALLEAKGTLRNSRIGPVDEGDEKANHGQDHEAKRVVHISEDGVESWLHDATSPQHQVSWLRAPGDYPSTLYWAGPHGIDTKSWANIPTLPYPASSVDLISSRAISVLLQSSQWPSFALECARVLRPGGIFEVTVVDPLPRNCGPLLGRWTAEKIILGLERRFLVTHPAMIIPVWLDDVAEFEHRDSQTLSFPAVGEGDMLDRRLSDWAGTACPTDSSASQSDRDLRGLSVAVGRYFYQAFYRGLVARQPSQSGKTGHESMRCRRWSWWWADPAIVRECQDYGTVFEMVTYRCRKKRGPLGRGML